MAFNIILTTKLVLYFICRVSIGIKQIWTFDETSFNNSLGSIDLKIIYMNNN